MTQIHNLDTVEHYGTRRLKITEKVSFSIASERSAQKLSKNAKNCPFWRPNNVTRQVNFNKTKKPGKKYFGDAIICHILFLQSIIMTRI